MSELGKSFVMLWPVKFDSEGRAVTIGVKGVVTHVWGDKPRLCNLRLYWQGDTTIVAFNVPMDSLDEVYEERQ